MKFSRRREECPEARCPKRRLNVNDQIEEIDDLGIMPDH
jgi:hypothetical protein